MIVWLLLFGAACAVQAACWIVLHAGFRKAQREAPPTPDDGPVPPMTVIVAARDEAERLPALLTALTRQTHPRFEILIVDDASTDATPQIVRAWQADHPHLHLLTIEDPQPPRKKRALARGIAAASTDLLAFTDADCTPPPDWLATLARQHAATAHDALLVGYSPFRRSPGLLGRLARYETFVTGFLTAAAIGLGRPYMAVGRTLSYPRTVFEHIDGFAHGLHAMSGDDDLLVQEVAHRRAASIHHTFDQRTFVPSEAPATWRQWLRQKRRHVSAGRYYHRSIQAHLTLFHATNVALWGAPLALGWVGAGLLGGKLLIQALVLRHAATVLHERDLLPAQPLLELLYAAYNLLVAPLGLARLPKRW